MSFVKVKISLSQLKQKVILLMRIYMEFFNGFQ